MILNFLAVLYLPCIFFMGIFMLYDLYRPSSELNSKRDIGEGFIMTGISLAMIWIPAHFIIKAFKAGVVITALIDFVYVGFWVSLIFSLIIAFLLFMHKKHNSYPG